MDSQNLGISVCGEVDTDLDTAVLARRAARLASGQLSGETLRHVETASFRPVSAGFELEDDGVDRLRRLCMLWDVSLRADQISSHRPVIGPLIVSVKRVLFRLMQFMLRKTLAQQRAFNAEVIQALAELSARRSGT